MNLNLPTPVGLGPARNWRSSASYLSKGTVIMHTFTYISAGAMPQV